MVGAARTLLVLATAAGLSLIAACTSGSTADCSPDAGGTPNANAWCGVPAGDASMGETTSPTDTGATDTGSGEAAGEAGPDGGQPPESGSPEAASDAPQG